jgi:hypothetical protein
VLPAVFQGDIIMLIKATSDLWWKNAIIYCLDVETFLDSNGDGYGDFSGLIQRIDYLAGMGVTCLWLMPLTIPRLTATMAMISSITMRSIHAWAHRATLSILYG